MEGFLFSFSRCKFSLDNLPHYKDLGMKTSYESLKNKCTIISIDVAE